MTCSIDDTSVLILPVIRPEIVWLVLLVKKKELLRNYYTPLRTLLCPLKRNRDINRSVRERKRERTRNTKKKKEKIRKVYC